MANTSTLFINGTDISEFGVSVLEYEEPVIGTPKDNGGSDLEGIDGIVPTHNDVFDNVKGSLTIIIEDSSELEVLNSLRKFKQYCRSQGYAEISTLENVGFYRIGYITSGKLVSFTSVPDKGTCKGIYEFTITFKDAYEYSASHVTGTFKGDRIQDYHRFTIYNEGKATHDFKLEFSSDREITGRIEFALLIPDENGIYQYGPSLTIGEVDQTILTPETRIVIDFSEPTITVHTGTSKQMKFSLYTKGQFFQIPHGEVKLQLVNFQNRDWSKRAPIAFNTYLELLPKFY